MKVLFVVCLLLTHSLRAETYLGPDSWWDQTQTKCKMLKPGFKSLFKYAGFVVNGNNK